MISPAPPRQASAQAMTHDSARVTPMSAPVALAPAARAALSHVGPVLVLGHEEIARAEGVPFGRVAGGGGGVFLLERLVAPVVGRIGGEVRPAGTLDHPVGHHAVDHDRADRSLVGLVNVPFSTIRSVVMKRRSAAPRNSGSKKASGASTCPLPAASAPVGVDEGGIEMEGRHGHQGHVGVGLVVQVGVATAVGGVDQAQVRVDGEDVGAQPGPGRQERHAAPRRRLEALEEHALIDFHHLDPAVLAGGAPVRVQCDRVERHEAAHHLAHLAGGTEQADIRPAVGDHRQVVDVGSAQGPDQRHGLATRAPPADADGHARAQFAHHVLDGGALVGHQAPVRVTSTCPPRASRRTRRAAHRPRRARAVRR